MKRFAAIILTLLLFTGCSSSKNALDPAMKARNLLNQSNGCTFNAKITADYGENVYTFQMKCEFDGIGNMKFTVIEPETIEAVSGRIDSSGGELIFDDAILGFPVLADGLISPVASPWFMINGLKGGYFVACGNTRQGYQIKIDDNYKDHMFQVDILLDNELEVLSSEIIWDGYRILTIEVKEYKLL